MDMYQKRKMRKEKNNRNIENIEENNKMNINWYPGHMAKTRRQIEEDLKLIDVVVELLDSRIPVSSRNPDIKKIIQNKRRIIVLNKCDLADEKLNNEWVRSLSKEAPTILVDAVSGKGVEKISKEIDKLMEDELARQRERGRINKTVRVMILGIPNVGKSSLINKIAKKNSAEVGNKPGVTKQKQWIRIAGNQELLDTPGVLWPRFESNEVALNLSFTGTIKDEILEKTEVAYELVKLLVNNHKQNLIERFKISEDEAKEIEERNENIPYEYMLLIGKKRGTLVSGGKVDLEKVSNIIVDDFRNGKIGKITLEKPRN